LNDINMLTTIAASCASATAGAMVLACAGPHAVRAVAVSKLRRSCRNHRTLVLSYDDGPGLTTTRVLDVLGAGEVAATFFVLGRRAAAAPDVVDQIAREGHELGCHSHEHLHAWKVTPAAALRDIRRGYETLSRWIAPDAPFRPPYGKMTLWTWVALKRRGAPIAFWTIDSGDTWATPPQPQAVADRVARDGGGVVLLHDFDRGAERERFVLRTTELLLETARREGLNVRTFSELIGRAARRTGDARGDSADEARISGGDSMVPAAIAQESA
jgi:peptidoglycan-N-acetylglucosamine deacetylase